MGDILTFALHGFEKEVGIIVRARVLSLGGMETGMKKWHTQGSFGVKLAFALDVPTLYHYK